MSIWISKKEKAYAGSPTANWLKRYVEYLTRGMKETLEQGIVDHCGGTAFPHNADAITFEGSGSVQDAIQKEIADRKTADETLADALTVRLQQESASRSGGDDAVLASAKEQVQMEKAERKAADESLSASLQTSILKEAQTRKDADDTLSATWASNLAKERNERETTDDAFSASLEAERQARTEADLSLSSSLQKMVNTLTQDKQPKDLIVHITESKDDAITADKTYAEILEAYNDGKRVSALFNALEILPLSDVDTSEGLFSFLRHGYGVYKSALFQVDKKNQWNVYETLEPTAEELNQKLSKKANAADVNQKLSDVETALDNKADKEEWKLINEVELTEDAVVEFTTDTDGNAFNLKKFKVTILMPKLETQSPVWLSVFNSAMYYLAVYSDTIPANTGTPAVSITGELTYAWQFETCYSKSGLSNSGAVTSFPRGSRYSSDITGIIQKVKVGLNSGLTTPLPAGSKITLWGCEQ